LNQSLEKKQLTHMPKKICTALLCTIFAAGCGMNEDRSEATKTFLSSPSDMGFIRFNKNLDSKKSASTKDSESQANNKMTGDQTPPAIDTGNQEALGYDVIASNVQFKGLHYETKFLSPAGNVSFLDEDNQEIEIDFDRLEELAEDDSEISMSEGSDLASYFFSNGVEISSDAEETIEIRTVPNSVLSKFNITQSQWDSAKAQAKAQCDGGLTPIWLNTVSSFKINNFQFNKINVDPIFLENKEVSGVATFADLKDIYRDKILESFTPDIRNIQTSFNNLYFLCGGTSPKVWKYTLEELIPNNVKTDGEYWQISMQRPVDSQYLSQVPITGGQSLANITMGEGESNSIFELPKYDHVEEATILPIQKIVGLISEKPSETPKADPIPAAQEPIENKENTETTQDTEAAEQEVVERSEPETTTPPSAKPTTQPDKNNQPKIAQQGPLRQQPVIFTPAPVIPNTKQLPVTSTDSDKSTTSPNQTDKPKTQKLSPERATVTPGDPTQYELIKEQVSAWTKARPNESDQIYSGILRRQFADYIVPDPNAGKNDIQYMLDPTKVPNPVPAGYLTENNDMWDMDRFSSPDTSATDDQVQNICSEYDYQIDLDLKAIIHAPYEYYHHNNAEAGQYYIDLPNKKLTYKDMVKLEVGVGVKPSMIDMMIKKENKEPGNLVDSMATDLTDAITEAVFRGTMEDTPMKTGVDGNGQPLDIKICFNPLEQSFDGFLSTYQTAHQWGDQDWKLGSIKKYEDYLVPKEDKWLKAQHSHAIDFDGDAYQTVLSKVTNPTRMQLRQNNSPSQMHVFCSDKVQKCYLPHKLSFRRTIEVEMLSLNMAKTGIYGKVIKGMLEKQDEGVQRRNEMIVYGAIEIVGSATDPSQWRWVSLQTLAEQGVLEGLDKELRSDVEIYFPSDALDSYLAGTIVDASAEGDENLVSMVAP
jgi:hypothetical protein